jgi:hypothetical protein
MPSELPGAKRNKQSHHRLSMRTNWRTCFQPVLQIGSAIIMRLNPRRYRLKEHAGILESDLDRILDLIDRLGEAGVLEFNA